MTVKEYSKKVNDKQARRVFTTAKETIVKNELLRLLVRNYEPEQLIYAQTLDCLDKIFENMEK